MMTKNQKRKYLKLMLQIVWDHGGPDKIQDDEGKKSIAKAMQKAKALAILET